MPTITTDFERHHVGMENLRQVLDLLSEMDLPDGDAVAITVQRPMISASAPHATGVDVSNQIEMGGPINDSAALAIASWYQSARGYGQTFNLLASGRPVAVDELLDAIGVELKHPTDPAFTKALEALARWATEGTDEN